MSQTNLDLDLLRSFIAIADGGSFAQAARQVNRSLPAISLQMRRLEQSVEAGLFLREGRRMRLSDAGHKLLDHARRLIALNDQALAAMRQPRLSGVVRLGLRQDFAEQRLPVVLAQFSRQYPDLRLEIRIERTDALLADLRAGRLDLVLAVRREAMAGLHYEALRRIPAVWIARQDFELPPGKPLPLVLFEAPCSFRSLIFAALGKAGIAWDVVYTTPSLSGLRAAVAAGLGVTARSLASLGHDLGPAKRSLALPKLGDLEIGFYSTGRDLAVPGQVLRDLLSQAIS
ncbi:LysR substrate-binding domain-containing protein [Ferrovibrio sp.]|uniref:LysR substrate-binding domain-containing protein n=1 Tax=Ferrovibrio sp. TaxID=1917215 RepID=UPI001B715F7E|nr:LysR substrate-binding domain-containing protein [Ferrovibrio sp.]MBP7064273.1 LysR family transcriptional regulator [Ferrovibrio sp.]